MPIAPDEFDEASRPRSMRCVAVVDDALPTGKAANAAAVMALTMGARQSHLVGEPVVDSAGNQHPGLIPIGIPVLGAPAADLPSLRDRAKQAGLEVVDFPIQGQQTKNYAEFRKMVGETDPDQVRYLGVMIYGEKKKVSRIVGKYSLLRDRAATDAVARGTATLAMPASKSLNRKFAR